MSNICVICGDEEHDGDANLTKCTQQSFERIIKYVDLWFELGKRGELKERLSSMTWSDSIFHHRNCYGSVTHKSNLSNLKRSRDRECLQTALCVICQNFKKVDPSKVSTTRVAKKILELKITGSADLKLRLSLLNNPLDVITNEIRYHPSCLLKRKNETRNQCVNSEEAFCEQNEYEQINNEYLRAIKEQLTSSGENSPTIDMNQLEQQYEQLLHAAQLPRPVEQMRRYIKNILQSDEELMSQVDFYHYTKRKPSVVANKLLVSKLICDKHFIEEEDDQNGRWKTAKVIRKELSSIKPWNFDGTFENFEMPQKLLQLITWIISDCKSLSDRKKTETDTVSSNITQYIYSNFKSDRQLAYQSNKDRGFEKHRLSPLTVGTALVSFQANRSKTEIESLSNIGIAINYDKLERIHTGIAMSLIDEAKNNRFGIILPSGFKKGIRPIFAADNIDLGSDASSFHGADLMIAQKSKPNEESLFPVCYCTLSTLTTC